MSQPPATNNVPGNPPSPSHDPDSDVIERITYLASLVSERSAIDKSLDTLRILTSRKGDAPFTPENRAALGHVEAQLKDYLLHNDRLREFNEQELEQRLNQHMAGVDRPQKTLSFWMVGFSSLAVALATMVFPTSLGLLERLYLACLVFLMLLTLWNVYFYRSALGNFRPELKRAFRLIYIGVALLGIQFVHFARLGITGDIIFPLFQYGGLTIPAFAGFVSIYIGLRRYAEALSITTILTSVPFFATAVALAAVVVSAYGFESEVRHPYFFSLSLSGAAASAVACVFSAGIAKQIAQSVTTVYGGSMRWLYRFHVLGGVGALGFTVTIALLAGVSGNTLGAVLGACGILPILVFAYSGYSFKKETSR